MKRKTPSICCSKVQSEKLHVYSFLLQNYIIHHSMSSNRKIFLYCFLTVTTLPIFRIKRAALSQ